MCIQTNQHERASGRRLRSVKDLTSGAIRLAKGLLTLFLLAIPCLSLAACGGVADGPVGVWRIDPDATLAANQEQIETQLESVPAATRADARRQLEDMFMSLEGMIELNADGSLVSRTSFDGRQQELQGTWEAEGETITTRAREEGSTEPQVMRGQLEGDRLVFAEGSEPAVVFRRD